MATRKKNDAPPATDAQPFADLMQHMAHLPQISPAALAELQADYLKQATALWNASLGQGEAPSATDRRFAAPEWRSNPAAHFMSQLYLLNGRTLGKMAEQVEADDKTKARIKFAVQQFVDAASPSNFLALNPEAQKLALDSHGETLARGLQQLWGDVQRGHVSQTDESAFEVGRNVATTAGSVVFENALFQLIEYTPLTPQVHARPFLLVPPCINKFYILDLQPDNSLIRYAVAEGHRVFVVSWRNPDESVKHLTWDDYVEQGAIQAIRVVQEISGQERINTLGFCVGGTILATALAVLAARGEQAAASLTLLTTLLDFADNGILDIFVDEASVRLREATLGPEAHNGPQLLHGQELATTFSFLRPNDLVWNYVVGNYLKGEAPPAFDLLYWNGDSTNLPGPMYCWYLRHTYLQNELKVPGKLTVCGEKLDLGAIDCPVYIYGSREDHIVPWQAAYRNTQLFKGKRRFVMGASGHIAGVINPPAKGKRSHWISKSTALPADPDAWLQGATEHPGSWWTDWSAWLASHAGAKKPAPKTPGNRKFKAIEPAPGRYVKVKA
ncbi:class I poly(R)-hydroxyalkanoic acid synthase [Pelomonas puraquae]|uniref:Class I poly(R)-hydroxyalkanoic acid synthase n=2 Tax=Roseateles puraquae TaxID=431059 RepID=A0A254NAC6_9BURK|nr:class I poly(R)-hydroxyalkanoic acid synthase [Roseateles puraquae]OWR03772.1 class I poly(R)-hydroxyalkanoic acid synthase [Roseateles puraquae]